MTSYRDRHIAGEYFGTVTTTVDDPNFEPEPATTAPTGYRPVSPSLDNLMRKELVAIADQHGIPNYGTRDQLLQRLIDRGVT